MLKRKFLEDDEKDQWRNGKERKYRHTREGTEHEVVRACSFKTEQLVTT